MSRAGSSVLCGGVDGYMADYNIHSVYAFYMHQRVTATAPPSRTRCYNSSWRQKSASTAQYESECDVRPWPVIGAGPAKSLRDMPCQPYRPTTLRLDLPVFGLRRRTKVHAFCGWNIGPLERSRQRLD
jgi:hypothetical protein